MGKTKLILFVITVLLVAYGATQLPVTVDYLYDDEVASGSMAPQQQQPQQKPQQPTKIRIQLQPPPRPQPQHYHPPVRQPPVRQPPVRHQNYSPQPVHQTPAQPALEPPPLAPMYTPPPPAYPDEDKPQPGETPRKYHERIFGVPCEVLTLMYILMLQV